VVFLLVVVFTLIQGPTLPFLARRLGVSEDGATREVVIDSAPLEEVDATLMQVGVSQGSRLAGVYVSELRLPPGSQVTLVVRRGATFVPEPTTDLREGDHLLLVTTDAGRAATERRLRAVSRAGRLAGWYGERGDLEPPSVPDEAAPPSNTRPSGTASGEKTPDPGRRRPSQARRGQREHTGALSR
jgi:cell volume regulation protein A